MQYWHELTVDERKAVIASGITVQEFLATYKVPQWCNDPDMIDPVFGCWSLCSNHSVTASFCKGCECYEL